MAKLFIYRNLHRDCYSIRYKGVVIAHASAIQADNVTFKVNEAGRRRVIEARKKNVHAFVTADHVLSASGLALTGNGDASPLANTHNAPPPHANANAGRMATYNPYKAPTFTDRATGEPVHASPRVILSATFAIYY